MNRKKINKLLNNPKLFFKDALINKVNKIKSQKFDDTLVNVTFVYGIHHWKKDFFHSILKDEKLVHLPFHLKKNEFEKKWQNKIKLSKNSKFLVWGLSCPQYLIDFANENNMKVNFVEDGFIRSIDLGANHSLPLSLNFDSKTPYFDSRVESDLEYLLNNYDFNDLKLIDESKNIQETLTKFSISKYNHAKNIDLEKIYGPKTNKRILVIGQVEDDASIQYGCNRKFNNNDLVKLAREENPDAQIIYKPHPDVLHNKRKQLSDPNEVKNISQVVTDSFPIIQAFQTIDHVYTITSLAGFEALIHGIKKVTTVGCPFYSGWGLTDDRQNNPRRKRKLTLDELFAASYLLYPNYYSPYTKEKITPKEAINLLIKLKNEK